MPRNTKNSTVKQEIKEEVVDLGLWRVLRASDVGDALDGVPIFLNQGQQVQRHWRNVSGVVVFFPCSLRRLLYVKVNLRSQKMCEPGEFRCNGEGECQLQGVVVGKRGKI